MATFNPDVLMGHDFIYFKLHGLPEQPYWYGDNWLTAISADQLKDVALTGTVIFVANCYLEESPFLQALLDTGAMVFGGAGLNFAAAKGLIGADLLGRTFRRALEMHSLTGHKLTPTRAFTLAKLKVAHVTLKMMRTANARRTKTGRRTYLETRIAANVDAAKFKQYRKENV